MDVRLPGPNAPQRRGKKRRRRSCRCLRTAPSYSAAGGIPAPPPDRFRPDRGGLRGAGGSPGSRPAWRRRHWTWRGEAGCEPGRAAVATALPAEEELASQAGGRGGGVAWRAAAAGAGLPGHGRRHRPPHTRCLPRCLRCQGVWGQIGERPGQNCEE